MRFIALVLCLAVACAPVATSPTPTAAPPATASPVSTVPVASSATTSPSATAAHPRLTLSNAGPPAVAGKWFLFTLPGDTRLRAISFDGQANGLLSIQAGPTVPWQQAPYGVPVAIGTSAYGFDQPLGSVPWPADRFTWSNDGRLACAVSPEARAAGSTLRLETAAVGQPARRVVSGFGSYSDNAGYYALACDEATDRVVVAAFGQGLYAGALWVFKLSTGALVRDASYGTGPVGHWLAVSPDATLLADAELATAGARWMTTIRSTDDGKALATLENFWVRGFSGDNALVVGEGNGVAVLDWKTGQRTWSVNGSYGGHRAEPAGNRFAVGVGFISGQDQRDVYLVGGGDAILLPPVERFSPVH
jgi:hypothetical protein